MQNSILSTGRRKTSVARVRLVEGAGKITINKRPLNEYFSRIILERTVKEPLELTAMTGRYDVYATVEGGGMTGQAGAIRLGIARALLKIDIELRGKLSKANCLTRDSRGKERKKYGQKAARARFQFSKR